MYKCFVSLLLTVSFLAASFLLQKESSSIHTAHNLLSNQLQTGNVSNQYVSTWQSD